MGSLGKVVMCLQDDWPNENGGPGLWVLGMRSRGVKALCRSIRAGMRHIVGKTYPVRCFPEQIVVAGHADEIVKGYVELVGEAPKVLATDDAGALVAQQELLVSVATYMAVRLKGVLIN